MLVPLDRQTAASSAASGTVRASAAADPAAGNGNVVHARADTGNVPPAYPPDAARRGEHGTVTLRLTIGTDGSVLEAKVAKSSGSERLDRTARDQIATWHFRSATHNGKPQIDVIELGVDFVLD